METRDSKEHPADLGSRGGAVDERSELWWNGPPWLSHPETWPPDIITGPTRETQVEAKVIKDVLAVAVAGEDLLNGILKKYEFWKAIRISAWIARSLHNYKTNNNTKTLFIVNNYA